jgi:DNA polymerase III epsilon subunit-like protein
MRLVRILTANLHYCENQVMGSGHSLERGQTWAVVYTRTTGIWERDPEVFTLQVAIILLDYKGQLLTEYSTYIDPVDDLSDEEIESAEFDVRRVRAAPVKSEVADQARTLISSAAFVVSHDVRFHRESLRNIGVTHRVWRCTRAMMFQYSGSRYRPKLQETAVSLGLIRAEEFSNHLVDKLRMTASVYLELVSRGVATQTMLPPWPAPYAKPYVKPYRSYTKYPPPPPRSTGSTGFIGMLGRGIGRGLAGGGRRGGRGNYPGGSISFGFTSKRTRYPKK